MKISHIALYVSDLEATKAFYQFPRHTLSNSHLCLSHDGRE